MAYNNLISRDEVFIPEEVGRDLIAGAIESSAALSLFPRIPVSSKVTKFPVLTALPVAYFVSGDTGLKQTTEMNWSSKEMTIEELAVIVPIPDAVLEDSDFDIFGEVRPRLVESIGRAVDAAIFFGVNKPASWPDDLEAGAIAAGHDVPRGSVGTTAALGGIAADINAAMEFVEDDGFDPTGFVVERAYRGRLRGARDSTGQKLLDVSLNEIEGLPVKYAMNGQWSGTSGDAELFVGDFNEGLIGIRRDFSFKLLDQAVITDAGGAIIYNLPQQDMVALRVTFRLGFQVSNAIRYSNTDEETRYPWAIVSTP